MVKRVLGEASFSLRSIAELTGRNYVSVRQWATGRRVPDPENRKRLADALRAHGERLAVLADELERDARG